MRPWISHEAERDGNEVAICIGGTVLGATVMLVAVRADIAGLSDKPDACEAFAQLSPSLGDPDIKAILFGSGIGGTGLSGAASLDSSRRQGDLRRLFDRCAQG